MSFRLSERSLKRLQGVRPRLVALVREASALTPVDFMVTEGCERPSGKQPSFGRGPAEPASPVI